MKKFVSKLFTIAAVTFAIISCSKEPAPTPTPTPTPTPAPTDTYTCVVNLDFEVNRMVKDIFTISGKYTLGSDTLDFSDIMVFTSGWSLSNHRADVPCNTSFNLTFTPKPDFVPAEHDDYDVTFKYTYTVTVVNQDGKEFASVRESDEVSVKGISFKKAAEQGKTSIDVLNMLKKMLDIDYKFNVKADGSITVGK